MNAAVDVLATHPGASMQEIADHSGLGRTTVYRHFPSREALFEALLADRIGSAAAGTEDLIAAGGDAEEVLRATARMNVEICTEYEFLYLNRDLSKPILQNFARRAEGPLARFLVAAQERGEIRADQPVSWLLAVQVSLLMAILGEVRAGRCDATSAAETLGETLVLAATGGR